MGETLLLAKASERVSIRRPLVHSGFETLAAHYVRQSFKPHFHPEYLIGVISGGVHSVWCRGERHSVAGGTVMTMRPGDVHHGNAAVEGGWIQRMFYVSEETMANLLGGQHASRSAPLPDFDVCNRLDRAVAARLERIHDVVHASELALPRDVALVAFADVVATLARDGSRGERAREVLPDHRSGRLVDYLHTHVEANVSLDVLSSLAGLSRRQTIDLFNRGTGLPPHAYHIGLKVRLVQDLLRKGQSLVSAAVEAGFADQSHMTRHFTAIVGMTPAAFAHV